MIKRPHTYRYCQGIPHLPSATHLRCQGSCPGSYSFLQAIPIYQAVPTAQHAATRCEPLKLPCFTPIYLRTFLVHVFAIQKLILYLHRAGKTAKPKQSARSLTASTSAFCAPAVALPAPRTGGTKKSTLARLCCSNPTDGLPTRVMRRQLSDRMLSTTL
jgi:hypothetical protein